MANFTFNVAKGRVNELQRRIVNNDPVNSALVLILLKATEVDSVLEDYATVDAILTAAGNTEADATNYSRIILTDAELALPIIDNALNKQYSDMPDQTYTALGGTLDNNLVKMIVAFDMDTTSGTDVDLVPLTCQDFAVNTSGVDVIARMSANGYFEAV